MDRIRTSNLEDYISGKIINQTTQQNENSTRIFYIGIVINNIDPLNANRIQVRIPSLDDIFYINKSNEEGNKILPWCIPINRNFISTPENNSIVTISIFDPKTPYFGRKYYDDMTSLSYDNIFDSKNLNPETNTYNNWDNVELMHNFTLNSKPKINNEYNSKNNINYTVGFKGKGNNKIFSDKDSIQLHQNENTDKHSYIKLTDNIDIHAAKNINLISDAGNSNYYHPVFDSPLYDYLNEMNSMIKSIVTVLNSVPSLAASGTPNAPSPNAVQLINTLTQMYLKFNQLKIEGTGASKEIIIN